MEFYSNLYNYRGIDKGYWQPTIDRLRPTDMVAERGLNEEENHP